MLKETPESPLAALSNAAAARVASPPARAADWGPGEFEAIFHEQFARIARAARRLAEDSAEAEELAGEAFWKLYRARPRERTNLTGWLYRAVTRAGLDAVRARRRRRHYEALASAGTAAVAAVATPLGQLLAARRAAQARAVLGRLQRREAMLLVLRHSGASYREMAAAAGVRASSIGTLLARAETAFEKEFKRRFGAP